MAPVYDTGNCLFYNEDPVPVKSGLLNVKVNSFCKKETDMLSYVKNKEIIDIEKLEGFPKEVEELLKQYTKMPEERAEKKASKKSTGSKREEAASSIQNQAASTTLGDIDALAALKEQMEAGKK